MVGNCPAWPRGPGGDRRAEPSGRTNPSTRLTRGLLSRPGVRPGVGRHLRAGWSRRGRGSPTATRDPAAVSRGRPAGCADRRDTEEAVADESDGVLRQSMYAALLLFKEEESRCGAHSCILHTQPNQGRLMRLPTPCSPPVTTDLWRGVQWKWEKLTPFAAEGTVPCNLGVRQAHHEGESLRRRGSLQALSHRSLGEGSAHCSMLRAISVSHLTPRLTTSG